MGREVPGGTTGRARLEFRLAGAFGVLRDGAELSDAEVGSRKSRTLLKLLAVEHPRLVPTDRIIEVLWADSPPAAAGQNVATLVSRLRGVLGTRAILGGRDGYRLAGEPEVSVDLETAAHYCEHAARTLPTSPAIALAAAGHAVGLLAEDKALADEPYAPWADPARAELRSLLRRARLIAAEAALACDDPGSAARYAEAAMAADPLDEAAHRAYMAAWAAAGEPTKALLAYAALRERLSEELGVNPARRTLELHLAILQERQDSVVLGGEEHTPQTPLMRRLLAVTESSPGGSRPPRSPLAPGREAPTGPSRPGDREARLRSPRGPLWSAGAVAGVGAMAGVGERGARFARRGESRDLSLVGREAETEALRSAWGRAVGGDAGVVMLVGEAGIGKTALAERLAAEAERDGGTVLRTRCYEAERSLFLQPLTEAARSVAGRQPAAELRRLLGEHGPALAALMPEFTALLGPSPSWHGSLDAERRRSFEAVTALLTGLAARDPVLLVVDDLQYAGRSTVEFIHYLGRHLSGTRLLVVVTIRTEHDQEAGAVLAPLAATVKVGPLSPEAVEQLAAEAGHGQLAGTIMRRTRGHALFVVEVLRALAAGEPGIPESLRGAVQARVRRVGPAAETLLRAASVLGSAIDPLVLGKLLDLAPAAALEQCETALQARLLTVSGRDYEFANDLVREILYATTPEPTRLAHHRRAADLLTGQPEALAQHAAAAGDWPRAARAWLLAAEEALRRCATSDSIALSTQALAAAEGGGGSADRDSPVPGAGMPGSAPLTEDATVRDAAVRDAAVRDAEAQARALVLRGCAREAAGDYELALTDLTLGAAAARAVGDRRLEMRALSEFGRSRPWMAAAAGWASHAPAPDTPVRAAEPRSRTPGQKGGSPLGEASGGMLITTYTANLSTGARIAGSLGDRKSEADMLSRLAVIAANRLRLDAALDYGKRAVAAGRAAADEQALAAGLDGLKTFRLNVGDLRGFAEVLAELTPLLRRAGDMFRLQWAEFETAFLHIAAADWDKAVAAMETGIELNRRGGYPHSMAWYLAHLGWLARLRGRDDEALTLGQKALDIADEHENTWWQAAACAMLGTTVLLGGDRDAAIGLFERGLTAAEESGMEAYLLRCAAPLAAATGSPDVLAEADRLLSRAGIPPGAAWLLGDEACLALARAWLDHGDPERSRVILAPLLNVADHAPWLPTLAATLAADGRARIRLGERGPAVAQLVRAEKLARAHSLPHVLTDARSALSELA